MTCSGRKWQVSGLILAYIMTMFLSGCGGGSSSSSSSAPPATTFSISGTVSGAIAAGVAIHLTGTATASTTTAAGGTYSFTGLSNGSYTVTPSLAGYTFNPISTIVTVSGANVSGKNFVATAAANTYSLSGTVTGPYVTGVTMTLSGAASGTVSTASDGTYSFAALAPGSYTLTPSLPGYTYTPSAPTITIASANSTQNFTAASAVAGSAISGTISYSGSKTGKVFVVATDSNGNSLGTIVTLTGSAPATANYTIRGATTTGSWNVSAFMDTLAIGADNANDPSGSASTSVTVGTDVTGVDMTLADPTPPTATAPQAQGAFPSKSSALVFFNGAQDSNNLETSTSFKLYFGTDAAATNGTGSPITVPVAGGHSKGIYLVNGLTDGTAYYFKLTAMVGATESAASTILGPITIGATTGGNTVSGTVTFPGTVTTTGHKMLAGVFNPLTGHVYFDVVTSPVSPQSYSISGVPTGNYQSFAIIDMNDDGIIDVGDLDNTNGNTNSISVSGTTTANETLTAPNSLVAVTTQHQQTNGSNDGYSVSVDVDSSLKLPVSAVLVSGPYASVPSDMGLNSNGNGMFNLGMWLNTTAPTTADQFQFLVTYSDGTSELVTKNVNAVLNNFATGLSTSGANPNQPTFNWVAPATAPAALPYSFSVQVQNVWYMNNNLPSSQTSVAYNVDGKASLSSLLSGTTYIWEVVVEDANGNQAVEQKAYTVP